MTAVETTSTTTDLAPQELARLFQYTVEAYKTFEKLAESLPNPISANIFKQFAVDERANRDLLEMKAIRLSEAGQPRVRATLGGDVIFQETLEGKLSYRETAEFLILREKTMQKKLRELINSSAPTDRNLLLFVERVKRAHIVELEGELELIRLDNDWWKREDAEWRIVYGAPEAR